ncbi:MAG: hypothetical protein ABI311_07845 [Gemmatimonadaceae bacterium]
MSAVFANSLRARRGVITIGEPASAKVVKFRVQVQSVWDVVRVDATGTDSIRTAKVYALNALLPDALFPDEFSVKLNGTEIFDESISLASAGVVDGSTLLVAHRRRRPVR